MNEFDAKICAVVEDELRCEDLEIVQVNLGFRCNQQCRHCHVEAGPERTEMMTWETMELVLTACRQVQPKVVDLTGGAPELNPNYRRFVEALRSDGCSVQSRTNLTILHEPGMGDLPRFWAEHQVGLVASLPCYLEENVEAQRGPGVYEKSIDAIRQLNAVGYGVKPELRLDLVYNPGGPLLPPAQSDLEPDYKMELDKRFGISFTHLLTITNMPLGRFQSDLEEQARDEEYMRMLEEAFNAETVRGIMCRHQISIGWDGTLYDCDFNLAHRLPVEECVPRHVRDFDVEKLRRRRIVTAKYCFGCTAGKGSSCRGALA
jgi:radical SAM/Cys-rich protein